MKSTNGPDLLLGESRLAIVNAAIGLRITQICGPRQIFQVRRKIGGFGLVLMIYFFTLRAWAKEGLSHQTVTSRVWLRPD